MVLGLSPLILPKLMNKIILAFENAATYNGLSTYSGDPITCYSLEDVTPFESYLLCMYKNETKDPFEDCIKLPNDLWATNEERTICEMIKYNRSEEWIFEALYNYDKDFNYLRRFAEKYNVRDKLEKFIAEM